MQGKEKRIPMVFSPPRPALACRRSSRCGGAAQSLPPSGPPATSCSGTATPARHSVALPLRQGRLAHLTPALQSAAWPASRSWNRTDLHRCSPKTSRAHSGACDSPTATLRPPEDLACGHDVALRAATKDQAVPRRRSRRARSIVRRHHESTGAQTT